MKKEWIHPNHHERFEKLIEDKALAKAFLDALGFFTQNSKGEWWCIFYDARNEELTALKQAPYQWVSPEFVFDYPNAVETVVEYPNIPTKSGFIYEVILIMALIIGFTALVNLFL